MKGEKEKNLLQLHKEQWGLQKKSIKQPQSSEHGREKATFIS